MGVFCGRLFRACSLCHCSCPYHRSWWLHPEVSCETRSGRISSACCPSTSPGPWPYPCCPPASTCRSWKPWWASGYLKNKKLIMVKIECIHLLRISHGYRSLNFVSPFCKQRTSNCKHTRPAKEFRDSFWHSAYKLELITSLWFDFIFLL